MQIKIKLVNFFKNPILFSAFIIVTIVLVLKIGYDFKIPDLYIDRQSAWQAIQDIPSNEITGVLKPFVNTQYYMCNSLFNTLSWFIILFLFSLCFKITNISQILKLNIFNSRLFAYVWTNLSYLIWGYAVIPATMSDLEIQVYKSTADSFGIPLVMLFLAVVFMGLIYYLIMNIIMYLTFNKNFNSKFMRWIYFILIFILFIDIFDVFRSKFTYYTLVINFVHFGWLLFIICILKNRFFVKNNDSL